MAHPISGGGGASVFQCLRDVAFMVTVLLLFPYGGARAEATQPMSLGSLVPDCERLESYWRQHPPTSEIAALSNDIGASFCAGFVTGFSQAALLVNPTSSDCSHGFGPHCHSLLQVCFPTGVLPNQILAVFLAYARGHTAQWHESVAQHFELAMLAAFPCKGGTP